MVKYWIPMGIEYPEGFEHTDKADCPLCMFMRGVEECISQLSQTGRPAVKEAKLADGSTKYLIGVQVFIPTETFEELMDQDVVVIGFDKYREKGGDN